MKNTITQLILMTLLMIIAIPAYSANLQAIQIFNCEFNDDATAEQVMAMASSWLKAAKGMPGGKNLDAYIRFPIAEGSDAEGDFRFVIATPSFAEWGAFTDAYEGSAAAKVDEEFNNLADCADSTMWEGLQIQ
ncbi:hypothetical protein ACFL3I_06535 [Pseudomonadota bacterium]